MFMRMYNIFRALLTMPDFVPSYIDHARLLPELLEQWRAMSEWRDSNSRPLTPEASTLPTALHPEGETERERERERERIFHARPLNAVSLCICFYIHSVRLRLSFGGQCRSGETRTRGPQHPMLIRYQLRHTPKIQLHEQRKRKREIQRCLFSFSFPCAFCP